MPWFSSSPTGKQEAEEPAAAPPTMPDNTNTTTTTASAASAAGDNLVAAPPAGQPSTVSATDTRANTTAGSRTWSRPAMFGRLGSVSIQRMPSTGDLGLGKQQQSPSQASPSSNSAAAASRHRAATIASPPIRRTFTPQLSSSPEQQLSNGSHPPTLQRPHVELQDAERRDVEEGPSSSTRPTSWTSALGVKGRRRANTSASRTSTGRARVTSMTSAHSVELNAPSQAAAPRGEAYDARVHDLLDVIDPEVQMLNTLGDIQNSLFIPYTGWFDRTRKVQLTKPPCAIPEMIQPPSKQGQPASLLSQSAEDGPPAGQQAQEGGRPLVPSKKLSSLSLSLGRNKKKDSQCVEEKKEEGKELPLPPPPPTEVHPSGEVNVGGPPEPVDTEVTVVATETVVKGKYFVLPSKLVDMTDWTEEEKADLDDYVRHLLHSRKERFRRKARGFRKYVSTPLGAFITIYASLLTFWGAAWVLFLIGWLNVGDRQNYFVEICDQILVALFCVVGIGLIPWRSIDTYHAYFIIKYHNKTLKLRKKRGLPTLRDKNDLPNDQLYNHDLEMAGHGQDAVLNDEEQALLTKHQTAFHKQHTYYRPHETATHHAFPIRVLTAIIILSDFHSCFQLALGSTTWSISYHHHFKRILTTVILCFSLSCNISAGILIAVGNRMSRKTEVVEQLMRKAITEEAIKRKEDADAYRTEKREKAIEKSRKSEDTRHHLNGYHQDDLPRTGSLPLPARIEQMFVRRKSDDYQRSGTDPLLGRESQDVSRQASLGASADHGEHDSPRS